MGIVTLLGLGIAKGCMEEDSTWWTGINGLVPQPTNLTVTIWETLQNFWRYLRSKILTKAVLLIKNIGFFPVSALFCFVLTPSFWDKLPNTCLLPNILSSLGTRLSFWGKSHLRVCVKSSPKKQTFGVEFFIQVNDWSDGKKKLIVDVCVNNPRPAVASQWLRTHLWRSGMDLNGKQWVM